MARKAPYRAVAKIDPDALASFQAGIRKRYSNEQILLELRASAERLGRSPTMREFAADAVLRVGRVLQRRSRDRWVVDAERHRLGSISCEVSHERIVRVDDQARLGRETEHRLTPARPNELELAVAVELVAEEIAQADRARTHSREHFRKGCLVRLEQPELRTVRVQQRRRHPGDEIRA